MALATIRRIAVDRALAYVLIATLLICPICCLTQPSPQTEAAAACTCSSCSSDGNPSDRQPAEQRPDCVCRGAILVERPALDDGQSLRVAAWWPEATGVSSPVLYVGKSPAWRVGQSPPAPSGLHPARRCRFLLI